MFGPNSHPIFVAKLTTRQEKPFYDFYKNQFSMGGVHFYMNDAEGWRTRVYIHNYFSLLAGDHFPAEWEISAYRKDGSVSATKTGEMGDAETKIIEVSELGSVDEWGIVHVHIRTKHNEYFLPQPYGSIFFVEHYVPETDKSIIAHSLGIPRASHFSYHRVSSSWITPAGYRPFFFVANSCRFHRKFHPLCGRGNITFTNYNNEKRSLAIPYFGPMASQKIDLFGIDSKLADHLAEKPYTITVDGENIMSKPFLFQVKGEHTMPVLAEHL